MNAASAQAQAAQPQVLDFDVAVIGSEPEAIAAAVAAAEEGARTVLVTADERLGGLFVLGELNVLDLRTQPFDYQRGLFERWWRLVGRDEAFDVAKAESAFETLLAAAGVEVHRGVRELLPEVRAGPGRTSTLSSVSFTAASGLRQVVSARHVIDGGGDADLAAAAGAGFDMGWSAFGVDLRMADTLVFHVGGVDWQALQSGVAARGRDYASAKATVVWGHFGGVPAAYQPVESGLRLRGLNLGRQDNGTVLVNALLIYGLDPLDPASLDEGRQRALREVPRVIAYLAQHLPGFANAHFAGAAERLYVRESRHLRSRCQLTADDVFDNRVTPLDVAAGGYPMDAQSFTRYDSGFVYGVPDIYGGRLCMLVPDTGPDNLWVVGRSAGFDPVPFSSARVVPFGMALAEAVGVAAALAVANGASAQGAALDTLSLLAVRERLLARGAFLPGVVERAPVGPVANRHYPAFRRLVARGLAVAGYDNDPRLNQPVTALSFAYLLSNVATRYYFRDDLGQTLVDAALAAAHGNGDTPLSAAIATTVLLTAACALGPCPPASGGWNGLFESGLTTMPTAPQSALNRGQAYDLAAALARLVVP